MTKVKTGMLTLFFLSVHGLPQSINRDEFDMIATTPTNTWQQQAKSSKPVPLKDSERQIRDLRDAYADKVFGLGKPIEELAASGLSFGGSDHTLLPVGNRGLIPAFPDEVIVTGVFSDFDEVLTQSHRAIYSEMHISLEKLLFPDKTTLSVGSPIDIITVGGSITTPEGKILSFRNRARPFGLTPSQKYVLFLRYVSAGNFYLLADSIAINGGSARPNSPDAVDAARKGEWPFLALNENDLENRVSKFAALQHTR